MHPQLCQPPKWSRTRALQMELSAQCHGGLHALGFEQAPHTANPVFFDLLAVRRRNDVGMLRPRCRFGRLRWLGIQNIWAEHFKIKSDSIMLFLSLRVAITDSVVLLPTEQGAPTHPGSH